MENENKQVNESEENQDMETKQPNEIPNVNIEGHIKIFDPETDEVFVDQRNAIHYENMSISLAESLGNAGEGFIYEMAFGNGGVWSSCRYVLL